MKDHFAGLEPMVYKSRISVPYRWWAGETATKFLVALRDQKKIVAPRCSECKKVYMPPRKTCPTCFKENTDWVELTGKGTLQSFTVARRQLAALPKEVPVLFGLIKLDGADTALLHYLDEVQPEQIEIGMRVEAIFAAKRRGRISDISHFRPLRS